MKTPHELKKSLARLAKVFWGLAALWVSFVAASFIWNLKGENANMYELALTEARSFYQKDLLYRTWATSHGGIYVINSEPSTAATTPATNNLSSEVTTTSGQRLILLEPDTIMRQVHKLAKETAGIQSHVTSLKPSRAENAPDAWETSALRSFVADSNEVYSVEQINGQPFMRLMRPMVTTAECMACHEERDHKIGEIRGGISVSLPMANYLKLTREHIIPIGIGYGSFAVVGLAGLWFGYRRVSSSLRARDRAVVAQQESDARYRRLHESMTDAFILVTMTGKIIESNHAFETLVGYSETELQRLTYVDLTPENWHELEARIVQDQILPKGYSGVYEKEYRRKDGTIFPVELRGFLLRDNDGQPSGMWAIVHDISERKQAEQALRESEERFRNMFQQIPSVSIQGYGPDGTTQYWNQASERLYGYTAAEAIGRNLLDLIIPPEMQNDVTQAIKWMAETGQAIPPGELSLQRKDGTRVAVFSSHVLVKTPGRPAVLFCVDVNLTERKQAEEEATSAKLQLERGLKFQQALLSAIPTPVFYKDKAGRYLGCNQAFTEIMGLTAEQVAGKTVSELWPGEHAEIYERADLELIQNPQRQIYEFWVRDKHGMNRDVIFAKDVFRDEENQVVGIVGAFMDITERKRAQAALQQNEAHLHAVVENLAECLFVLDQKECITYLNPEAERIFGFRSKELKGRNLHDAIHHHYPDGRLYPASECKMTCVCQTGEAVRHHEDLYFRKDGSPVNVVCSKVPIILDGKVTGAVLTVQDITEHRKLEGQFRQAQKMESFGQLAGGVAHDFNNILAAILLQCEMFGMDPNLDNEHLTAVQEIEKSAQRAANLTRQLLLFSRKQILQASNLNLNEVVANIAKMLQRLVVENIAMQLRLTPGSLWIHADAGMIDQVLLNLAVNARDAMPDGGQINIETAVVEFDELAASQHPQARPGSFACLSVSDTGCGIPPETIPRIFEPFFTTKEIGKGTGLGLATVFGIVQQHHGWINVHSIIGRGTTFLIYLPRLSGINEPPSQRPQVALRGGNETILLVEDDSALRISVRSFLDRLGYHVLEASSSNTALEIWKQHHQQIQLLLTDLMMPDGVNGRALGQRLLQDNPKLKVIYCSGYSNDMAKLNIQPGEGGIFLSKPFQSHELAQAVRSCLDSR